MHLFFYQQSMAPLLKKMINYNHGDLLVFVDNKPTQKRTDSCKCNQS